jgi:hypothetical protein
MTTNAMRRTLGILLLLLPGSLSEAQDGDGFIPLTDPDAGKEGAPELALGDGQVLVLDADDPFPEDEWPIDKANSSSKYPSP